MNLYDHIAKRTQELSQLSTGDNKSDVVKPSEYVGDNNTCPDCHLRARKKESLDGSVPSVTSAREEDKGVFPSLFGNNTNTNKSPSHARVPLGTESPGGQESGTHLKEVKVTITPGRRDSLVMVMSATMETALIEACRSTDPINHIERYLHSHNEMMEAQSHVLSGEWKLCDFSALVEDLVGVSTTAFYQNARDKVTPTKTTKYTEERPSNLVDPPEVEIFEARANMKAVRPNTDEPSHRKIVIPGTQLSPLWKNPTRWDYRKHGK